MKITAVMVATYMFDCCLVGTKPCKYFQLNSPYFNNRRGVFSKIDLDQLIPQKWRLPQQYDDGKTMPEDFPVFLKPEWGENAAGIYRADNPQQLQQIRQQIKQAKVPYVLQQGAKESREFEIFSLQHYKDKDRYSVFSVTESTNSREQNPINSINNPDTTYLDVTRQLSEQQKQTLWNLIGQIGRFGISRLSVRADSIQQLIDGNFHVIELNLFTPMPIHLLDTRYGIWDKWKMIRVYMMNLARLTKYRDKTLQQKPIYTKTMFYNRENTVATLIREKL